MKFSERYGYSPKKILQVEIIDGALKNALWDLLSSFYLSTSQSLYFFELCEEIWVNFCYRTHDTFKGRDRRGLYNFVRNELYYSLKWFQIFDLIEFIIERYPNNDFSKACNNTLKKHLSAYRIVSNKIVPITSEEEIAEIEEAIIDDDPFKQISTHLKEALNLLANRKDIDISKYRNSIKESISAVESICRMIVNNKKVTLGQSLKELQKKIEIHPALKTAIGALYGYTSDEAGIRHGMMDDPNLDFEDAKFMLVSCSSFINYLKVKSIKAGIILK